MLVGEDGSGILADFGLCIANADACLPEFLGDGTAEYAAPEITSKLTGSTLCTELYSWFVVFAESVMMRHPFAGEVSLRIARQMLSITRRGGWPHAVVRRNGDNGSCLQ